MSNFERELVMSDNAPPDKDGLLLLRTMVEAEVYRGISGDTMAMARQLLGWHALQTPEPDIAGPVLSDHDTTSTVA